MNIQVQRESNNTFLRSSMENNINIEIAEQGSPEVPSLIRYISSSNVAGFDTADSQPPSPYAQVRLFFKHFTCIIEYYKANFQKLSFFFHAM